MPYSFSDPSSLGPSRFPRAVLEQTGRSQAAQIKKVQYYHHPADEKILNLQVSQADLEPTVLTGLLSASLEGSLSRIQQLPGLPLTDDFILQY